MGVTAVRDGCGRLTPRVSDAGRRDFRWKESGRLDVLDGDGEILDVRL